MFVYSVYVKHIVKHILCCLNLLIYYMFINYHDVFL